MHIFGVSADDARKALIGVGDVKYDRNLRVKDACDKSTRNGPRCTITIGVQSSFERGARRSASGRRVAAACWHAHYDVMLAILDINPEARITTGRIGKIVYNGREDFLQIAPDTAHINVGNAWHFVRIANLCECE